VPETEPGRTYRAASDAARSVTGRLTLTLTTRMPAPDAEQRQPIDFMSLRAETGLTAEGVLDSAVQPSVSIGDRTIRTLMDLDVRAAALPLYRLTNEATTRGGRGFCEEGEANRLVIWESQGVADQELKVLALSGDAPGQAGARACGVFTYVRETAS